MKELTVEATTDNVEVVINFINSYLEEIECPKSQKLEIDVAADEIFSNIAYYAYDGKPGQAKLIADYNFNTQDFSLTFIDKGKPYNPLDEETPDLTLSVEDRPVGGLGVFIVKSTMDKIEYTFENDCNHLKIVKNCALL